MLWIYSLSHITPIGDNMRALFDIIRAETPSVFSGMRTGINNEGRSRIVNYRPKEYDTI